MSEHDTQPNDLSDAQVAGTNSRQELHALYSEKRAFVKDQQSFILGLVECVGFDQIMDILLKGDGGNMTSEDRNNIHQYLAAIQPPAVPSTPTNDTGDNPTELESTYSGDPDEAQLVWTLEPTNNLLYSISPFLARNLFTVPMASLSTIFIIAYLTFNFTLTERKSRMSLCITHYVGESLMLPTCPVQI